MSALRPRMVALAIVALVACDPWKSFHDIKPVVESIQLSTAAVTINYRDVGTVSATAKGKNGFDLEVASNIWSSDDPAIVNVTWTGGGATAELHPTGVGSTLVRVSAGDVTRTIAVSVPDTAYGVTVTPSIASLTVGDTITLAATVAGPAAVNSRVKWHVPVGSGVTILAISPDSTTARIQVTGTSATLIARAVADTTKTATPTLTVSPATLVFATQPATVGKLSFFASPVRVEVRNASGAASARSASVVSVVVSNPDCGASGVPGLLGRTARAAAEGAASFAGLRLNRKASGCTLLATASPFATAATSAAFDVTPRDCTPTGYALDASASNSTFFGDTVAAFIEADDCPMPRPGGTHPGHAFSITVAPGTSRSVALRYSSSSAARVESALWSPATAFGVDSAFADSVGAVSYGLGAGVHQFRIMAAAPGTATSYLITSETVRLAGAPVVLGCRMWATRGTTYVDAIFLGGANCPLQLLTKPGVSITRQYVTFLPAGQEVTAILSDQAGADPTQQRYLEVLDVTSGRAPLGTRDHTTNGSFTVAASASDRWIEFVVARSNEAALSFILSIQ